MKNLITIVVIWLIGMTAVLAQNKHVTLTGRVLEKETDHPIEQTTVQVLSLKDSSFVAGMVTRKNGNFTFSLQPGKYILKVSFIGFRTLEKDITLPATKSSVDIGTLYLEVDAVLLDEAVVVAEAPPVSIKADTIEYNVSVYRTPEGAMLEELIKKLPGAEVDNDGKITINGKEVKKIMVDGKEFFSDNPKVSMKNLPVNMVEKVKAYDKKSDAARITGVDDGEEETVLDLTVKKDMKKGWIGNLIAGYGNYDRYETGVMLSRFKDDTNFSLIGSLNNTNNQGFSEFGDAGMTLSSGGAGSGITSTKSVGLDYARDTKKLRLGGDIQYGYSENDARRKSSTETFIGEQSSYNNNTNFAIRKRHDIGGYFRMEWRPDSMSTIIFRPMGRYSKTNVMNNGISKTFNNEHNPINNKESESISNSDNYSLNGRLQYFRRLNNKGRNFSLSANFGLNDAKTNSESFSQTRFYRYDEEGNLLPDSLDIRERNIDRFNNSYNYSLSASYTEPIFKKHFLQLRYEYRYKNSEAQSLVYNQEYDNEEIGMGYKYADSLSNRVRNRYTTHDIELSFRGMYTKIKCYVGVNFIPQTSKSETTIGPNANRPTLTQNVLNFSPNFMFRYLFSKQHQVTVRYRGRSNQPDIESLQEIIDITDPLNLRFGNPNLKPSFNHNFMLFYNKFVPGSMRSYFLNIFYSNTRNSVANRMIYNTETGAKESYKENVNGNWNTRGYFSFNTPFKNKKFTLSSNANISFSDAVSYTSVNKHEDAKLSTTHNFSVGGRFTGNYRCDVFDFSLNASIDYTLTRNSVQANSNRENYDYFLGGNTNINFPWEIYLSTDINYRIKRGYSSDFDNNEIIWNVQLSKNILKNKGTIRFKIYDILQQQSNLSRTISETQMSDIEYNTLGSYFMVNFVYRFNTLGQRINNNKSKGGNKQIRSSRYNGGSGKTNRKNKNVN